MHHDTLTAPESGGYDEVQMIVYYDDDESIVDRVIIAWSEGQPIRVGHLSEEMLDILDDEELSKNVKSIVAAAEPCDICR